MSCLFLGPRLRWILFLLLRNLPQAPISTLNNATAWRLNWSGLLSTAIPTILVFFPLDTKFSVLRHLSDILEKRVDRYAHLFNAKPQLV